MLRCRCLRRNKRDQLFEKARGHISSELDVVRLLQKLRFLDLAIKQKVPAEELSALEIECMTLPAAVEEVSNNDDHPRPNRVHPLDISNPSIQFEMADNDGITVQDLEVSNHTATLEDRNNDS